MGPDNTILRPARPDDAAEIARLAGVLGYPTSVREMASRLERLLGDLDHEVVVAEGRTGLLGWAHVARRSTVESPERAELMGLVVDPSMRRTGTGTSLVAAAEVWAAIRGLSSIVVRSNVARPMAHAFYEKVGYSRVKTQHVYVIFFAPGPES